MVTVVTVSLSFHFLFGAVHPLSVEVAQLHRTLQSTVDSYNSLCAKLEELNPSLVDGCCRRVSVKDQQPGKQ